MRHEQSSALAENENGDWEATARGRSESLEQVLIGAIVLEDLDLMVDCVTRKLHPRDPRFTISEIE